MSLLVLGLAGSLFTNGGGSGALDGAALLLAASTRARNNEASEQQTQRESELLEFSETGLSGEAGDVEVENLLKEVNEGNDPGKAGANEDGGSGQSDLSPGEALDDHFAVLGDLSVLELGRDLESSAAGQSGFEVLVAVLESGGVLVQVLEGVPAVQSEEGEEGDFQDESAEAHCDL